MDAIKTSEAALYVTLVEAAQAIGESPDALRRAMKQSDIRAVKENPENKRSRWLVALEDVKRHYGFDSNDAADTFPDDAGERSLKGSGGTVTLDKMIIDAGRERPPTEQPARAETPSARTESENVAETSSDAGAIDRGSRPINPVGDPAASVSDSAPEAIADGVRSTLSRSAEVEAGGALPIASRGEELAERFIDAVDLLRESLPEAPFDYQALLDKYVQAVERAAEANIGVATLKNRIADLNDHLATTIDKLDEAYAENRRLLAELDSLRSDLAASLENPSGVQYKALWKKRNS